VVPILVLDVWPPQRGAQGGLNQLGSVEIHVRLQHASAKPTYPLQNRPHVACLIQDEEGGSSRLHEGFYLADEFVTNADRGRGIARAPHHGGDRCSG
jgi:hypothetical protein